MNAELLPIIWFLIIGLEAALYVILDGANLGMGILSLFPQKESERSIIMRAFGPMWDANETWLLIAAATTYGAFPMVYGIALNALYIPAFVFGIGLVLRVVSYEFFHAQGHALWEWLFGASSLLAVVGQGLLIGGFLSGITVMDGHFGGGMFDWATGVTFLFTVAIVFGYMVLGYTHLISFGDYELSPTALSRLTLMTAGAAVALIGSTFLLPKANYLYFERWALPPSSYVLDGIAALIAICAVYFAYLVIMKRGLHRLHWLTMSIFALGFVGMAVGIYPYILPPSVTIFEAAASESTQRFMLWGIGPILPIVLIYNYYIRRIFSRDTHGYE